MLPTIKYSTKRNYQYFVRVHLYPQFGDIQLRLISRDAVQPFLAPKLRSGLSWRTVKSMRTAFGTIMVAAEAAELVPSNPVRKKIRELLNALPEPSQSLAPLLVLTGRRIGELLALSWRNVHLEHGVLRVTETVYDGHFDTPKSRRSQRLVLLGAGAIRILAARKPAVLNPDALVFGTRDGSRFDRHNLSRRIQLRHWYRRVAQWDASIQKAACSRTWPMIKMLGVAADKSRSRLRSVRYEF